MGHTEADAGAHVIERAREGDTRAFETILEAYEKPVFNAAYRIVANYEDAADVTQTVFLKVHKNLGSYRPEHKFLSWIYRIAVNEAINFAKRHSREHPLDDAVAACLCFCPGFLRPSSSIRSSTTS